MPAPTISTQHNARAALFPRYISALQMYLAKPRPRGGEKPRSIGSSILAANLATVDVAILHEQAMLHLAPVIDFASNSNGSLQRAGQFLAAALLPFEAAQRVIRKANRTLLQRNETLRLHAAALERGNRRLAREVTRRQAGEQQIRLGKERYRTLFLDSVAMQKTLRQLTRQIISAQEEERKEISRELHDEVVQTLVGINVELSALGKGVSVAHHTLRSKISLTQRLVETSVNAVHRFARELRPAVLDDLGLIPALHSYCRGLTERKKIKIRLTAVASVETLAGPKRTVLFRVAQEALTNVVRHAHATQVKLTITAIPNRIRMEIEDNGKSFPIEKVLRARNPKRLGLIGMKERVEMVGGTLAITSAPGAGTTVRAELPFKLHPSAEPKVL